jgi:hypothetical protein
MLRCVVTLGTGNMNVCSSELGVHRFEDLVFFILVLAEVTCNSDSFIVIFYVRVRSFTVLM